MTKTNDSGNAAELRTHLHEFETLLLTSVGTFRDMVQHESVDQAVARMASVLAQTNNPTTLAVMAAVAIARLAEQRPTP